MVWNRFSLPRCWAISVVLAGTLLLPGCENRAPAPSPAGGSGEDTPTETDHTTPAELTGEQKEHPENRLAHETSPYLLLHAHNPVDWYPWGEEALAKAREENKPIFLSVGYSSCYWCHVMERESFMDEEIAAFMNEHFVCIKVDREERPDIDDMAIASLMNLHQNPGWPVSLFLTPDGFPFAGTSYMPARDGDREGMPGFLSMIRFVAQNWGEEEAKIRDDARRLSKYIASTLNEEGTFGSYRVGEALSRRALGDLASGYDAEYGGFFFSPVNPQLPKFPTPAYMSLLQRQIARPGGSQSLTMLVGTLGNMARGGIYDHVGGGFHRYSTDRYWEIPHFEKMLYDNGQLATAYAQAYEVTRDEAFSEVAAGICDFVLRDMTSPAGGFYTAIDAETNRIEGEYYRWSQEQLAAALTPAELELAEAIYGLHEEPNFEGFYVLAIPAPLGEIAAQLGLTAEELREQKVALDSKLLAARQQREMPLLDTKILTDWNGLMIRGLAETGRVLEEPRYTEAAARAADFLLANARDEQGRLWHVYTDGQAHVPGYLDDYAFFIDGLIALHESTGEQRWLAAADELAALQMELFYDEPLGGFFFTSTQHEEIIARGKDFYDRALPSGNAVSVGNLLYLAEALDRPQYLERAGETVHAAGIVLNLSPLDATRMVVEALRWKDAIGESETELVDTQPAAGHVQPSIEPLAPTDP